jgi:hypothetical protein
MDGIHSSACRSCRGLTESAGSSGAFRSGSLILPAISHIFTISYVAEKLGEDAEWLWEFQINMFPEDGCLWGLRCW